LPPAARAPDESFRHGAGEKKDGRNKNRHEPGIKKTRELHAHSVY
jgi:hypothetical protein